MKLSSPNSRFAPRLIVITGASGAIGGALAQAYAAEGVRLVLQGRDLDKLEGVAALCEEKGAVVDVAPVDLADLSASQAWCDRLLSVAAPDLVILSAGMNINTGPQRNGETWCEMEQLLDLNVKSTLMLAHNMALAMKEKGSGQIALLSSLAAFYGLPVTPSYSASKAAVKAYSEALRGWLAPHGIGVTVIMPGYVGSEMCHAMPGPKPFLWSAERAAAVIKKRIARNPARVSFPFPLNLGCWALSALPPAMSQHILKWLGYGG